ncbi:MAG: chaperone modulator CbpM [Opitutaceae bacterium]
MNEAMRREQRIIILRPGGDAQLLYSLEAAAQFTGVHSDLLRRYCRMGLLGEARAAAEAELIFDDNALYEVRRIERFRRRHHVNLRALPLVCAMAGAIARLEREIRLLRNH